MHAVVPDDYLSHRRETDQRGSAIDRVARPARIDEQQVGRQATTLSDSYIHFCRRFDELNVTMPDEQRGECLAVETISQYGDDARRPSVCEPASVSIAGRWCQVMHKDLEMRKDGPATVAHDAPPGSRRSSWPRAASILVADSR